MLQSGSVPGWSDGASRWSGEEALACSSSAPLGGGAFVPTSTEEGQGALARAAR